MYACMDGWMDGRTDGRMYGVCMHACMRVCKYVGMQCNYVDSVDIQRRYAGMQTCRYSTMYVRVCVRVCMCVFVFVRMMNPWTHGCVNVCMPGYIDGFSVVSVAACSIH